MTTSGTQDKLGSRQRPLNALTRDDRWAIWGIGIVGALGVSIGFFGSRHLVAVTILALIFAGIAVAWALPAGLGGLLSLGHAAFFGIGAYATAYLNSAYSISPWLGMVVGCLISGAFGAATTWLSVRFRVRGSYFALITLAWAEVLRVLVTNSEALGRSTGIYVPFEREPGFLDMQFATPGPYLTLAILFVVLSIALFRLIDRSSFGWRLSAMRGDEVAAQAIGINVRRNWVWLATISAIVTSIGGTLYVQYVQFVDPSSGFGVLVSIFIAVRAIIGGARSAIGPVIGAVLWAGMSEVASIYFGEWPGTNVIIFGVAVIIVAKYAQNGLVGGMVSLADRWSRRRDHE